MPFIVSTTTIGPAPGDFLGCAGAAAVPVVPRPAGACAAGFCPAGAGFAVEPCSAQALAVAIATTAATANPTCLIESSR